MNSMTGFGSSLSKNRHLEVEVQVKSVNGRFLETRFHLPKEYAPFENDFRKAFGATWSRGTVDIFVHRRPSAETRLKTVKLRSDNAKYWAETLRTLAKELKVEASVSLRDILQMPFVLETQDRATLFPGELQMVEKELRKAADKCLKVRTSEGAVLKKDLLNQITQLEKNITDMLGWREEAMKAAEGRIKVKISALSEEQLDSSRLAIETALLIDKMDVHEEITRLREHLKACRLLITKEKAPHGKKLDFYCQELLREVNTIGSKSQLSSLTQVVVSSKAVIEKFREQVQNIE